MAAHLAALAPEPLLRNGLIIAHAASGAIAFTLGVRLAARHPAQALCYLIALTLMAVFVTGAVILDWHALTPATRGIFTALLALAPTRCGAATGPAASSPPLAPRLLAPWTTSASP